MSEIPSVNLDPVMLIGRVYYGEGSYEEKTPFDAVFTVMLLGDNRAKLMAAHGRFDRLAYGAIARILRDDYGITSVDMDRHKRPITVDVGRASDFGDL